MGKLWLKLLQVVLTFTENDSKINKHCTQISYTTKISSIPWL